ncbi:MAG TPA: tyrosine-type recombinase/integrase [Phycisphaerae bacterium]|nr:tyrosine-type recombinase/integrase [Phycisphaerae bacterium]
MSIHKLDLRHNPIPEGSTRQAATRRTRGEQHYLFEFRYNAPPDATGKRRQCRTRVWLPDWTAAEALERELRGEEPMDLLAWNEAWEKFFAAHQSKRSEGHLENMARDVRSLVGFLGNLPIEQTPLARYTDWLRWREAQASGRTAQLARTHTLKMARWTRSHGLVESLPFENAPVPEATPQRRTAATPEGFLRLLAALPSSMAPLWKALGYTGARISGMAALQETDVGPSYLTVTTKRGKRVSYLLLPPVAEAVEEARRWKRYHGHEGSKWVFLNSKGSKWSHQAFDKALATIHERHPYLPRITPHQLRHMFATLAAAANFSPDMIQAGLGHDDRRSAESYIHHTQAMGDTVAATVGQILEQSRQRRLAPTGTLALPEPK